MFKDRLRSARKSAKLTQKEVAVRLGITESTYCGYETGKREPDVLKIKAISSILGVSGDYLLETGFSVPPSHAESDFISFAPDEQQLINDYRRLSPAGKEYILQTMAMALRSYSGKNNAFPDLEEAN